MKKFFVVLLALLLFLLVGCSASRPEVYTVEVHGEVFAVDTEKCTVTHGEDVYQYEIDGSRMEFTYPNGATYWWAKTDMGGHGGWDGNYDANRYVSGGTLVDVLEDELPGEPMPFWKPVAAVVLALLGLWQIIWPDKVWYWSHGWQYKNAEPSDMALFAARVGGVLFIVLAVVLFFI